ncbi:hypothetical protein BCR33DRAFT_180152 [Rhizoclosmatium globosum]|uniref:G-protein coupled receptors family 1 profile domain-containing protein n=1 Tax=Rhizoclosmatium globosum TaxID=329046 RepID=A0A1Y2D142_9FUNG|nr:hypothetical protein BCR33DRAFT_180152 [Rhizoclosmatium globosum]|eukprot:ORY52854.1 hypothetical protein BCR33DRAFT_180152 [Rhizoclosmatium globosum]
MGCVAMGFVTFVASSTEVYALTPKQSSDPVLYLAWRSLMTVYYILCCIGIFICYAKTYWHVQDLLNNTSLAPVTREESIKTKSGKRPPSPITIDSHDEVEKQQKHRLQQKVLFGCVLMSAGIVICYLPYQFYWYAVEWVDPDASEIWYHVATMFAAFDVLMTPGVTLFFRRDLLGLVKKGLNLQPKG